MKINLLNKNSTVLGEKKETHPFFALILMLIIVSILAEFIPSGEYVRTVVDGRTMVDPQSYHTIDKIYVTIPMFFTSFYQGFVDTASLMAMLFFVGAGFGVLKKIKLFETVISSVTHKLKNVPFGVITAVLMLLFGLQCAFTGLYDLAIVFIPIIVPLVLTLGYDAMTGVGIVLAAECIGFGAAFTNPWFTAIAQDIAELPIYSGLGYRILCFVILMVPGYLFVMQYAAKVKRSPEKSILYGHSLPFSKLEESEPLHFTPALIRAGIVAALCFAFILYGSVAMEFSFPELASSFAAMGILTALAYGASINDMCYMMADGMREMFMAAMVMIFARSILYIMNSVAVIDTIIHFLAGFVIGVAPSAGAILLFLMQTIINFFIPSGSGQAAITMPMIVPLADMGGINRQVACLASQFGDGFSNFIWPTVGTLLAILAVCGIPYTKWVKWFLPLFVILSLLACVLLIAAVQFQYGPF